MGRKKATSLKKDTKQLLDEQSEHTLRQRIDAATTPAASLFSVDTTPAPAATGKKQRGGAAAGAVAGAKRKREDGASAAAAASSSSAMDTDESGNAAAPALFEDDSDDEPTGIVERNRYQRSAHKVGGAPLVSEKESKRLKVAARIKAEAEAAVAARPAVFDVWATDREEDLLAGIRPPTNEKGFRNGRLQQRAFRHRGQARAAEHVVPSVLPDKIHDGVSFHPDKEKHQELLRVAYEQDEKETAELAAIRARFHVGDDASSAAAAASTAASAAAEDDSWMDDDGEVKKNAATVPTKYSKTKRNQMARAAANAARQQAAMDERQLAKFVNRLPVLVSELKKEEKAAAKERARVEEAKLLHPDRKPRLGRYAEESLFPEVALSEELPEAGALRKLRPSMHVVKEQFARFQERHLIETRKRVKPTKGLKKKAYERYRSEDLIAQHQATLQKPNEGK